MALTSYILGGGAGAMIVWLWGLPFAGDQLPPSGFLHRRPWQRRFGNPRAGFRPAGHPVPKKDRKSKRLCV